VRALKAKLCQRKYDNGARQTAIAVDFVKTETDCGSSRTNEPADVALGANIDWDIKGDLVPIPDLAVQSGP
jgi:hypothetical protein